MEALVGGAAEARGALRHQAGFGRQQRGAKRVWLATDCDREGQLIGHETLEHCGYRGEVLSVLFTAQDAQTIREAFGRARPNSEHARLYAAAVARRQADQIYNLSLTRTATVRLGRDARGVIGVGRVKTPTLAIACKRELEIRDFVPIPYYEVAVAAEVEGGAFRMQHAPKDRILKRGDAEAVTTAARDFEGLLGVRVEDKRQRPPRLHDLTSLQKLCNARFGWSASKTLEVAQELYDGAGKKIPDLSARRGALPAGERDRGRPEDRRRTASREILQRHLRAVAAGDPQGTERQLPRQGARRREPSRGHSQRQYDRGSRRYLAAPFGRGEEAVRGRRAVLPRIGHARLPLRADDGDARCLRVRVPRRRGPDDRARLVRCLSQLAAPVLPVLRDKQAAGLLEPEIEDKETRPPPRYKERTLIEAMQNASRFVVDEALRDCLKEAKGIGTPTTRVEIVVGLRTQRFLTAQVQNITPTERGLALFGVLERVDLVLVDPSVTAELKCLIDNVVTGRDAVLPCVIRLPIFVPFSVDWCYDTI